MRVVGSAKDHFMGLRRPSTLAPLEPEAWSSIFLSLRRPDTVSCREQLHGHVQPSDMNCIPTLLEKLVGSLYAMRNRMSSAHIIVAGGFKARLDESI